MKHNLRDVLFSDRDFEDIKRFLALLKGLGRWVLAKLKDLCC